MNGFFKALPGKPEADPSKSDGAIARLRAFLRNRPDREHEIIVNRLVMSATGLAYLNLARAFGFHDWTWTAQWFDAYLVIYTVALTAHFLRWPAISIARRVIGIACDILAITLPLHFGGEIMSCLFPILLWAIFGNGFRFGVRYLFFATGVSVALFSVVVATTPFWTKNLSISVGLLLGLVILPTYVSVLIRQLSEAKRHAEEANKAKTLFLASVSHELRTPLNAIIGLSDLLVDSRLDEDQVDMSRVIGRSGRSLLSLINSILDISRMECGYPNAKLEEVDLYAFVADLRDMLTVQAQSKELRLTLHIESSTPRFLSVNARHFEEILVNLAGNAIKFTDRGFVMIHLGATEIDAATSRLRFEVVDTGIGIAAEATGKIFDRFTQADESIIDRFGGTGLGLAIAKQLVEGMGGEIGVESAVGDGSVFWVEIDVAVGRREAAPTRDNDIFLLSRDQEFKALASDAFPSVVAMNDVAGLLHALSDARDDGARHPVVLLDARALDAARDGLIRDVFQRTFSADVALVGVLDCGGADLAPEIQSMLITSLSGPLTRDSLARVMSIATIGRRKETPVASFHAQAPRIALDILVAEDNRTNQLVIRKILERAGHAVTIVADGQAALESLVGGAFDLALMDVNMPVMNGVDATKFYQFSAPDRRRTPIAALTADATSETQRRCLDAGMIACITKPIEPDRLVAWLDAFQSEHASNSGSIKNDLHPAPVEATDAEPIDNRALNDLKSLGGDDFVSEIVDQFLGDAACVLKNLHAAVSEGDVQRFRDEAHALRSCAANVGAQKVYKLCLDWRAIDARELAIEGEMRIRRLETEFERARDALASFRRAEES
jgi:two-component system sensor histidine kinase RpfC